MYCTVLNCVLSQLRAYWSKVTTARTLPLVVHVVEDFSPVSQLPLVLLHVVKGLPLAELAVLLLDLLLARLQVAVMDPERDMTSLCQLSWILREI